MFAIKIAIDTSLVAASVAAVLAGFFEVRLIIRRFGKKHRSDVWFHADTATSKAVALQQTFRMKDIVDLQYHFRQWDCSVIPAQQVILRSSPFWQALSLDNIHYQQQAVLGNLGTGGGCVVGRNQAPYTNFAMLKGQVVLPFTIADNAGLTSGCPWACFAVFVYIA